jgi:DNA-binding NtrC family response regulator
MTHSQARILIADDEPSIRSMLETGLTLNGFGVTAARSGREALAVARERSFDAVVCDVFMPDGDGLSVVRGLREIGLTIPIILVTAQGGVDLTVQAMQDGATDFIAKPFDVSALVSALRRLLNAPQEVEPAAVDENHELIEDLSQSGLVGRSQQMLRVYKVVAHAARTEATVLVTGESGTGKELVAQAIHKFSPRAGGPFIAVNCSGLTDTLLESELFGHIKGAFTGAIGDRGGLFEAADKGTLFLDELASTSPAFQASLLRALESGEVRRVGSTQSRRVDVRVIGASNQPLREMAMRGDFRADLFFRLSVLTIELPPLRERRGDVELLTYHFLRQTTGTDGAPYSMTRETMNGLRSYSFPGNVRELQNALRRAVALSSHRLITLDCLPPEIATASNGDGYLSGNDSSELISDRPSLDELQRRYLEIVLTETGGNRRKAAEILGVDRRTIQRLLSRYKLSALADADIDSEPNTELELDQLQAEVE